MKPLTEWTEAELLAASDKELTWLLAKNLFGLSDQRTLQMNNFYWPGCGNGMLEVLEAMKDKGDIDIEWPRDGKYRVWFGDFVADHSSLPRAVAVAALLAMKGQACV